MFLLLLLIWTGHSTAQIDGVFYNPFPPGTVSDFTENPTYQVGSTVQLRWSVTWDRISLCLTQFGNRNYEFLLPNVTNMNNYDWIVSTSQTISNGNVFSLSIYDPGTHDSFSSHYFNLTDTSIVASPSTFTSAGPASATTAAVTMVPDIITPASATMSSATVATNTSPPSLTSTGPLSSATNNFGGGHHNFNGNDDDDGGGNGLSSTTKIGIGVGLGVGIPLFIALGIAAGWTLRSSYKRRRAAGRPHRWQFPWTSSGDGFKIPWISSEKPKAYQKMPISPPMPLNVQELPGPLFIYELPNGATPRSTMAPAVIREKPSSRATSKLPPNPRQSTSQSYFDPAVIRGSIISYEF
ncbi:hypothetical protein MMC27_007078 [Xylographa pallens]|nr:hypothetical protein [Xylographa pallens]